MNPSKTESRRGAATLTGLALAVGAGATMPVQSRVNGALGVEMDSAVGAALVSFLGGLLALLVLCAVVPRYRRSALGIGPVLARGAFPRWYLAAGCVGAGTIIAQALAVPLVGVALFTVCLVTGQTLGALVVDRTGFALGIKRRISPLRLLGAALTVGGVVWAASPRFAAGASLGVLLVPLLFAVVIGFLMGFQSAANGVQAREYGSPVAATLMNFTVGSIVLAVAFLLSQPADFTVTQLPTAWWYYIGGIFGVLFVVVSSILVRSLGVLLTGLGMIGGQLLGSLLLDLLFPSPGTLLHPFTVAGTVLTLLAIGLASAAGSTAVPPRAAVRRG